jgi:effector-binding domain-containing protein
MGEYTLSNSAAVVDASIQKVAGATTTPIDGSPLMVTSGGVKAYVDTQITNNPVTATLTTEVAELSEDFYKETFSISGTVSSSTTLTTFTAPKDGLYVGVLVGTYSFSSSGYNSIFLYWENLNETVGGDPASVIVSQSTSYTGTRFAFTREPVPMLQGQTIKLKSNLFGNPKTATYDLTFKITRLA